MLAAAPKLSRSPAYGGLVNQQHPLNRGLLGWWLALPQRYGGTQLVDVVGGYNATLTSGAAWTALPRAGGHGALFFDGTNDYATTPATRAVFSDATRGLSVFAWVNRGVSNANTYIFGHRSRWAFYVINSGGSDPLRISFFGVADVSSSTGAPTASIWYHLGVTMDAAGATTFYVNGKPAGTGTMTGDGGGAGTPTAMEMGAWTTEPAFSTQRQDDVRFYRRQLSAGEAFALYEQGLRGNPDTLARKPNLWWAPVAGGAFTADLSGTLALAGTLTKQAQKGLAGTLGLAGAAQKQAAKPLSGALAFAGTLQKQAQKAFAAALALAGSLSLTRVVVMALSGTLALAGTLQKQGQKALAAALGLAGTLARSCAKPLAGALGLAGAVAKQGQKALAGTLTLAGSLSLVRAVLASFAATLTLAGAIQKRADKGLAGTLTLAGALGRSVAMTLAATLALSGSLAKGAWKALSGALSWSASFVKGLVVATPPLVEDAVDFPFTQADSVDFPFTQEDSVDFV
jgi:hypothetical protein